MPDISALLDLTADIVAAFVSNNTIRATEIPELITTVHASLTGITSPTPIDAPAPELKPAVPVKKSVTDDFIICLEDGKKFKSLKRHLNTAYDMTPHDYRLKWGLPHDYPMVAPGYAAKRSALAKESGLGSDRRKVVAAVAEPVEQAPANDAAPEAVEPPAKRRGRPKKLAA